jgi:hypothetical protein
MGFYCANYYADPHCYNNVVKFGEFCTACIESRRGWSVEVLNDQGDSKQSGDRTSDQNKTQQPKDVQQRDTQFRNTPVKT